MNKEIPETYATIFDAYSEDSLRSSLKPAWEYVIKFLQKQYPYQMKDVSKYSDEMFYIILFFLEEYSLRTSSATLTEKFYNLSRKSSASKYSFMSNNMKWLSLLSVVLLPYMVEKFEKSYENISEKYLISNTSLSRYESYVYKFYPILKTALKWLRIINYMLYLFGKTSHAYPMLALLKIRLIYGISEQLHAESSPNQHMLIQILRFIPDKAASALYRLTPFLLYSVQFLDTFYQDGVLSKALSSFKEVKPPAVTKVVTSKLPDSKEICPLCHSKHVNPTTTAISGFVFCYTCLFDYIQQFKCCPITYRPCAVEDLLRLHVS